jgi:trk system potassium uptake protein TrkH
MGPSLKEYRVVFHTVGRLLRFFSLMLLVPLVWVFRETTIGLCFVSFVFPSLLSLAIGLILNRLSRDSKEEVITVREGAVIVTFSWATVIVVSALPYMIYGLLNFSQAIFEATSGWTTTGLTMFRNVESLPKPILFWRSLTQYLGGAGFAVIMMSTIIGPTGLGFYQAEGRVDNIAPNIRHSTRLIITYYLLYALFGTIALKLTGLSLFDALNHSFTALATGGFSTKNNSIASFNKLSVELILMFLMFLGATGFGIHHAFWSRDWHALKKNSEPKQMLILIFLGTASVAFAGVGKAFSTMPDAFRHTVFQIVSALTGTGFSTVDLRSWLVFPTGFFVLIVFMLLGGCMDSTSGGIKQYRLSVLIKTFKISLKRFLLPKSSVVYVEIWKGSAKKYLEPQLIKEAFVTSAAYILSYVLGTVILTLFGYALEEAMFEFASALAGVGLSCGITSADMPLGAMWTLTVGMFMGRLEFLVVVYALAKIFSDLFKSFSEQA